MEVIKEVNTISNKYRGDTTKWINRAMWTKGINKTNNSLNNKVVKITILNRWWKVWVWKWTKWILKWINNIICQGSNRCIIIINRVCTTSNHKWKKKERKELKINLKLNNHMLLSNKLAIKTFLNKMMFICLTIVTMKMTMMKKMMMKTMKWEDNQD